MTHGKETISLSHHLAMYDTTNALPEQVTGGARHPPITLPLGFINQELAPDIQGLHLRASDGFILFLMQAAPLSHAAPSQCC